MSAAAALLRLACARAWRHPGRFLLTALGLALATAFAGTVAAEGTIAGDQAGQSVLRRLSPLQRTVRVSWPGVLTPAVRRRAEGLLAGLGLGPRSEAVVLGSVRLGGIVVTPAAIAPLDRWVGGGRAPSAPCRTSACPMAPTAPLPPHAPLDAPGVHIPLSARVVLGAAAPLGFLPGQAGLPSLLLSGDPSGLEALPALSSVYRTHSWIALLPAHGVRVWQLGPLERGLQAAQDLLLSTGSGFSLTAPFDSLDAARAQAAAAPRRLLLTGGGAVAAILLFLVLAVGGLRSDLDAELGRLEALGATSTQRATFVVVESGLVCAGAILAGCVLAVAGTASLAQEARIPVGPLLAHTLLTPTGALAALAAWLLATGLVALLLVVRTARPADVLAGAAGAALVLALARGSGPSDPLPVLLAPLCCLVAAVVVARAAPAALRGAERAVRRGPALGQFALVGLARAPAGPAIAIAFVAVSTGLGAFALAYRATLLRGSADQAAQSVPLDAIVSAGPDFTSPVALATPARWRALTGAAAWPVRRTYASYLSGGSAVTVPTLGVPAAALRTLRGWRASDGSAPLRTLAERLAPTSPTRTPGPRLPATARWLVIRASSPGLSVRLAADLRTPDDRVLQVPIGDAAERARTLRARLPAGGPFELEGIALSEPTGLEITNGHQNAENPAAATRFESRLTIGPPAIRDRVGRSIARLDLSAWLGTGAAGGSPRRAGAAGSPRRAPGRLTVRFAASGQPGLLRPRQPSDAHAIPVLVDPQTAAAARSRALPLTVDGIAIDARIVGVLHRFATVGPGGAGFVVADQATLAGALDAGLPGQGRADELWLSTTHPAALRTLLARRPFAQLNATFRADIERNLDAQPVARAVLGTLIAATTVAAGLAVLGLLVALLGSARDPRIERDLVAQGAGPRAIRRELRLRLALTAALGVAGGLVIGAVLTRLAVATVRASGAVASPTPALQAVAPWGELILWALIAGALLGAAAWAATRRLPGGVAT